MTSIELTLKTESPLHIGGEVQQGTWADRPIVKWRDGWPYVPATTIKGRLRHEVEMLVRRAIDKDAVCDSPRPEGMCQPDLTGWLCPVCELFGTPWLESPLYFDDLTVSVSGTQGIPLTAVRTSTRLNPRRQVVEDKYLFDTEMTTPGLPLEFKGWVHCIGTSLDLTPLYMAAAVMANIGGGRSRGLGWCTLAVSQAPDPQLLVDRWEDWVNSQIERYLEWLDGHDEEQG